MTNNVNETVVTDVSDACSKFFGGMPVDNPATKLQKGCPMSYRQRMKAKYFMAKCRFWQKWNEQKESRRMLKEAVRLEKDNQPAHAQACRDKAKELRQAWYVRTTYAVAAAAEAVKTSTVNVAKRTMGFVSSTYDSINSKVDQKLDSAEKIRVVGRIVKYARKTVRFVRKSVGWAVLATACAGYLGYLAGKKLVKYACRKIASSRIGQFVGRQVKKVEAWVERHPRVQATLRVVASDVKALVSVVKTVASAALNVVGAIADWLIG